MSLILMPERFELLSCSLLAHRHSRPHYTAQPEALYPKRATYERAMAASIFESTPSCAKITVPEG
jgi:hypothetical protein